MDNEKRPLNALIVEDSEDDARLLLRELERAGFAVTHERVETATALQAALERQQWDVLLSDYTMPLFSGMEALQLVKDSGMALPFLFVSGRMGEDVAVAAMKAGADDYLMKGSLKRLAAAIERALRDAEIRREHALLKRTVALERERAFARLQAAFVELTHANVVLQQFAHVASHDLQEPLRAVAGCGQLLQRKYAGHLDPNATELIQMMVDGSARMKALIADLLAFSLAGRSEPLETVEASTALWRAVAHLSSAITESEAEIVATGLPSLRFAWAPFVQVLQKLVGNAIKYRGTAPPKIEVSAQRQGEAWVFRVADNGIGFEAQHGGIVFEISKRLHPRDAYPGTGISLALVKSVVERRGGKVWAESTPGGGSRFFFSVPDREPEGIEPGLLGSVLESPPLPSAGGSTPELPPASRPGAGEPGLA